LVGVVDAMNLGPRIHVNELAKIGKARDLLRRSRMFEGHNAFELPSWRDGAYLSCDECGELGAQLMAHPYASEIADDHTIVRLCYRCACESAQDV
jgi:hypothetical protein